MSCCQNIINQNTPCECSGAGFCARHQCEKTEHFATLCRTHPAYFSAWEKGQGPCMNTPGMVKPRRIRLGDWLSRLIYLATFGLVKECAPCNKRRRRLNEIGFAVVDWLASWRKVGP